VNGAEPTSHEEEASRSARAQEDFIVILTVNRLCRIFTIATLGFGGGWSIMTAETKAPTSAVWVAYICIITDWVVLSTALDCTFPKLMDWYFRTWPKWPILAKGNGLSVRVTGYSILNTLIGLGIAISKYALQNNQPVIGRTEVVVGSIVFVGLYWLGRVKEAPESPCRWFFYDNYGKNIFNGVKFIYSWATWWWIANRIHAVVNILRNRDKPEMTLQFYILTAGLAVEFVLLVWFFSIPFLFGRSHVWSGHLPPLVVMLVSWMCVVVLGLWVDLPNIFFLCSGSTNMVCRVLTTYAY
jgi:hypothetical protein